MTQLEVERTVERHKKDCPLKIATLARDLGVGVKRTDQWDDSVCGAIVKDSNDKYTIWTNGKHPQNRRRFTVAHEIAHFVLHRDAIGDGIKDDVLFRSSLGGLIEAQANRYAAELLMPDEHIEKCIKDGASSIAELAACMRVSKTAMSIRLGVPWE